MPSSHPKSATAPGVLPLEVRQVPALPSLLAFNFQGTGTARPQAAPGLGWLGGDFSRECWAVPAVTGGGELTDGWWASSPELISVALNPIDDAGADVEPLAFGLYRTLIDHVRAHGYPELLRIWHYIPGINHGTGDGERYRRFCLGRGRALAAAGLNDRRMCAATAIGNRDSRFRLFALAGRRPGWSFENPRQISAWEYPRDYGPRSPAFARATAVALTGGRIGLLISGTASVVGHATAHPGDVRAQTDEAAANVEVLLVEAARRYAAGGLGRLDGSSRVRVYVRHPEDWPVVEYRLRQRWPEVALAGLRGDICRRDLLVEIEAWHAAPQTAA